MPSKKISDFGSLTSADNDDIFILVDNSVSATRNITREGILISDFSSTSLSSYNIDDAIIELDKNITDVSATMTSGGVISTFGRTGHVVAISGDYLASAVTYQENDILEPSFNVQDAIDNTINQNIFEYISSGHGFSVGSFLFIPTYFDLLTSGWEVASASYETPEALASHLVYDAIDVNTLRIAGPGKYYSENHGLTLGQYYTSSEGGALQTFPVPNGYSNPIVDVDGSNYINVVSKPATESNTFISQYNATGTQLHLGLGSYDIIEYDERLHDQGLGFPNVTSGSSWKFTAPTDGFYRMKATCILYAVGGGGGKDASQMEIFVNGSSLYILDFVEDMLLSDDYILEGDIEGSLSAGDYVDIRVSLIGTSRTIGEDSYVSITKLSNGTQSQGGVTLEKSSQIINDSTLPGAGLNDSLEYLDDRIDSLSAEGRLSDYQVIYVSTSGIDNISINDGSINKPYKTLKFTMENITDSSNVKSYTVLMNPGVYIEDNPIIIKDFITIGTHSSELGVRITALNPTETLLSASSNFIIEDLNLNNTLSGCAIEMETSGNLGCRNVTIFDCACGLHVNNPNASVNINNFNVITQSGITDKFVFLEAGNLLIRNVDVIGTSTVDTLFYISGATSIATIRDVTSFSPNINTGFSIHNHSRAVISMVSLVLPTIGIEMSNGVNSRFNNITIFNSDVGFLVNSATSGCTAGFIGSTIQDSIEFDVKVLDYNSTIFGSGVTSIEKSLVVNGAKFYANIIDLYEGDEGVSILGELHVGTPQNPAESVFGEGDSYTRGMLTYTYNSITSAVVDVSVSARSASQSTFMFSNSAVDSAIYVSSLLQYDELFVEHYGIKVSILSAHDGTGNIISEYWNGSVWIEMKTMTTESVSPYLPEADLLFQTPGSHQIRYDAYLMADSWTVYDPPEISYGNDLYWIRFRISSATNVSPVFEQFKIHSNRFEINGDGWIEYFGKSRPIGKLPWSMTGLQKATTNPGDGDLYFSDNVDVGYKENAFAAAGDRVAFASTLPLDLDTSSPVKIRFAIRTDGTGDFNYIIRYLYAIPNSDVYPTAVAAPTTHPNEVQITGSVSAVENNLVWLEEELDFSKAIARRENGFPDVIAMSIERDTGGVSTDLVILDGEYIKWSAGGHI